MQSTDFRSMVDAAITGTQRRMAKGGKVKKHPLTVIIVAPPAVPPGPAMQQRPLPPAPVIGALIHAMALHHAARKLGLKR